MYMQVPTVTTSDGGGAAEVVENMDGGLLVPYGDHERLGQALVRFRKDEIFRKVQGERGRVRVENHFLVGVMAKKYATMYRRLLAGRPESNRTPA
jgi:glycosyltransferase involved in cell wall biosynthesis